MTTTEYLAEVLKLQKLEDDSQELINLQTHRAEVEKILRETFKDSNPTIRYGGSKAKGTLISAAYDLDIICYFEFDDTTAGESLEDIYKNVRKALEKGYYVEEKNSSLRLKSKDLKAANRDFHIDVVPGRFVDESKSDCFIHQNNAEKSRMKTNLQIHIDHVKDSGLLGGIRLLKLWKVRKSLQLKQFVWELLVIKILEDREDETLESQLKYVWTTLRDTEEPISIKDPANPNGNDLSGAVSNPWPLIRIHAGAALRSIDTSGWEAMFGSVKRAENSAARITLLTQAAATAAVRSSPWASR